MIQTKFVQFVEGQRYINRNIPAKFIKDNYFTKNTDGTYTAKVCGLANLEDIHYFFFPKGYNDKLAPSMKKETAKLLFQTLMKYKSEITLSDDEADWLGTENKEINILNTIDWLIRDYQANGLYIETQQTLDINGKGRIDWNRTIKQQLPYIYGSDLVYLDVITGRSQLNINDIITQIHREIINKCLKHFGWLYNIPYSGEINNFVGSREMKITILKQKLKGIFVAHDIKLIGSMITYLENSKAKISDFSMVTPYFYTVWEKMLQHGFRHDDSLQKYVPRPYWYFQNKKSYTRQIPDILVEYKNELIIMDAKYYTVSTKNISKLPGWESIVKQMYYNLSLDGVYEDTQNIFIMPESLNDTNGIKYIGYTSVEGKEQDFKHVFVFSIDIDKVLRSYTTGSYLDNLFSNIILNSVQMRSSLLNES